jgi:hypothetical protein
MPDHAKAFEKETAATLAQNEGWLAKLADELEKDGWTEAAARARTQLPETKKAAPTKAKEPVKAAEKTKGDKG